MNWQSEAHAIANLAGQGSSRARLLTLGPARLPLAVRSSVIPAVPPDLRVFTCTELPASGELRRLTVPRGTSAQTLLSEEDWLAGH